eukprot:TRINITY_DN2323_c0_g1_i1.p1 TRINITY_DN2323_c0_g1~~TRINITY_DN2323_c0_g1_i1.p1  ORF type:complete len:358 (-),score=69.66 TRINITY_DN2323_c0_g1_i1:134-1207(-)
MPKVSDCESTTSSQFGKCQSIICVDGPEYDGVLLSPDQKSTINGIRITMAFLSLSGSVFMLFTMVWFRRLGLRSVRMIFSLTICNLLESLANLLSISIYRREIEMFIACYTQGVMLQFASTATFGWITAIAINLYLVVVKGYKINNKIEVGYHVFVWGFALIAATVPFSTSSYGIAGLWCWLDWDNGQLWRWTLFYIPLFVMMLVVIVLYGLISYTVSSRLNTQSSVDYEKAKKLIKKLQLYPIIFVGCYLFSIINRIYDWASPQDSFALYLLESLTTPLVGFVNALVYGLDENVKSLWKAQIRESLGLSCCVDSGDEYGSSVHVEKSTDDKDSDGDESEVTFDQQPLMDDEEEDNL